VVVTGEVELKEAQDKAQEAHVGATGRPMTAAPLQKLTEYFYSVTE
jgi:hypothetical protein